jgi:N-acetylneuraminic acid mutarotase
MDGFGCSAFAVGQQLIVTTVSGSIQGLSPNQSEWEYLGQLDHNRFFHRVLPLGSDSLLIVGGANMEEGKTNRVEVLRISSESLGGR